MNKIAGVVILYYPTKHDIHNIYSYINNIDLLYIIDNTPNTNNKSILPNDIKIKYIANNKNLGISASLNIAAEDARKNGYKWLMTMDQDTNVNDDVIPNIRQYINKINYKKIAIVTPWHNTKLKISKSTKEIDHPLDVMTSANFVNLEIHKKIGGFDENLFIDGVDIEYCLRLNSLGYSIDRLNNISVNHNLGNIRYKKFLWKNLLITNHNYLRRYYMNRNYHYIYYKYHNIYPEFCNKLIKFKSIVLSIILYEKDKLKKLIYMYKGYKDYKNNIYGKIRNGD